MRNVECKQKCANLIVPQPSNVSPEVSVVGGVGVQGGVCVGVMVAMIRDPLDRVALHAEQTMLNALNVWLNTLHTAASSQSASHE